MRRPATDAELDAISVSEAEVEEFKRQLERFLAEFERLRVEVTPVVGVAMLRAACQYAVTMGLPVEDLRRTVQNAIEVYPADDPDKPTHPEPFDDASLLAQARRFAIVAERLYRRAYPTDRVIYMLNVGVSVLGYHNYGASTVEGLFEVAYQDAERAIVAVGKQTEA